MHSETNDVLIMPDEKRLASRLGLQVKLRFLDDSYACSREYEFPLEGIFQDIICLFAFELRSTAENILQAELL
jgi:hypothetical protein